jgi:hypothetical protein
MEVAREEIKKRYTNVAQRVVISETQEAKASNRAAEIKTYHKEIGVRHQRSQNNYMSRLWCGNLIVKILRSKRSRLFDFRQVIFSRKSRANVILLDLDTHKMCLFSQENVNHLGTCLRNLEGIIMSDAMYPVQYHHL